MLGMRVNRIHSTEIGNQTFYVPAGRTKKATSEKNLEKYKYCTRCHDFWLESSQHIGLWIDCKKMLNKSINWHSKWKWNQTKGKNQHLWHFGIQVCRHIDPNIWIVLRFSFNTDFQWVQRPILKSVYGHVQKYQPPFWTLENHQNH